MINSNLPPITYLPIITYLLPTLPPSALEALRNALYKCSTYLLTYSYLAPFAIYGQVFASERGVPRFHALA